MSSRARRRCASRVVRFADAANGNDGLGLLLIGTPRCALGRSRGVMVPDVPVRRHRAVFPSPLSRYRRSARPKHAIISSISLRLMISGGLKATTSPMACCAVSPRDAGRGAQMRRDAGFGIELCCRLVADELDLRRSPDHALADQRMIGMAADRRLHARPERRRTLRDDVALLVDLQCLERDGGRHRMRRVRVCQWPKMPSLSLRNRYRYSAFVTRLARSADIRRSAFASVMMSGSDRKFATDMLPVRPKPEMTSSTTNDDRILESGWSDRSRSRRHDDSAAPITAGEERGDRIGASANQLLEAVGEPRREASRSRLLSRRGSSGAAVCRYARDRQIESCLREGEPVRLAVGHGHAVVRALARNDLLLLRPAERVVDIPRELDRRVVASSPSSRTAACPCPLAPADRRSQARWRSPGPCPPSCDRRASSHICRYAASGEPPLGKSERRAHNPTCPRDSADFVIVDIDASRG